MRSFLRVGAAVCGGLLLGSGASALNVRVLVAAAPQLTVRVAAPAPAPGALNVPGAPTPAPLPVQAWTVGASGTQLTLNGQPTGSASLYLPPSPGSVVEIAGKAYRGGVQLRAEKGGVQRVRINVDLKVRDEGAADDNIRNVYSYEDIVGSVKRQIDGEHINLVETLAERIAEIGRAHV